MNTFLRTFIIFTFSQLISCSPSKEGKNEMQSFLKIFEPKNLLQFYSDKEKLKGQKNISSCSSDISLVLEEVKNVTNILDSLWALRMVDSSTKIPSGILAGNLVDLGMYDECVSVSKIINKTEIQGRHCLYSFQVQKIPAPVTFSICVPSSCGVKDLKNIFEEVNKKINETDGFRNWTLDNFSATCSNAGNRKISTGTIVAIVLLATIVLFLMICTILDWIQTKSKSGETLAKFSLLRSTRRIFNTKQNPSSFPVLHGLRTLSIFWVVYGHSFTSRLFVPFVNSLDKYKWFVQPNSLYIFLAPFAVDTFFVISGFLMTYLVLKNFSSGRKFNIFMYYLHRYIRLTPAIAVLLLIAIFILPYLGSGPLWEKSLDNMLTETCKQKWWTVLIYVQNYVRSDIECLGHTWYLAADMHFYLLSPIILIPLAKRPKLGLIILFSFFVISSVIVGILIAKNGYNSTLYSHSTPLNMVATSFRFFYTVSHTRASSWLVGIFLGYVIHSRPSLLNKTSAYIGWTGALGCFIFCILGQRIALEESYVYSSTFETSFAIFSRPIWAIGVAWIIFTSIQGYGGVITKFLSLSVFAPFGRLSYCIYIVHATFQIAKVNSIRTADIFSEFPLFICFLSELSMTIILAFFFSILFESPVMVLEKMMFRKKRNNLGSHTLHEADIIKSEKTFN